MGISMYMYMHIQMHIHTWMHTFTRAYVCMYMLSHTHEHMILCVSYSATPIKTAPRKRYINADLKEPRASRQLLYGEKMGSKEERLKMSRD